MCPSLISRLLALVFFLSFEVTCFLPLLNINGVQKVVFFAGLMHLPLEHYALHILLVPNLQPFKMRHFDLSFLYINLYFLSAPQVNSFVPQARKRRNLLGAALGKFLRSE